MENLRERRGTDTLADANDVAELVDREMEGQKVDGVTDAVRGEADRVKAILLTRGMPWTEPKADSVARIKARLGMHDATDEA